MRACACTPPGGARPAVMHMCHHGVRRCESHADSYSHALRLWVMAAGVPEPGSFTT
jgi:hypothetical protein